MVKPFLLRFLFWTLVLLVLVTTLMPLDGIEPIITFDMIDKVIHFVYFFILAILLRLAYPGINPLMAMLGLIAFGFLIEILQHVLPTNRSFDLYDGLFDAMGAIAGIWIFDFIKGLKIRIR